MQITHVEVIPVRIPLKPARYMVTALGWHTESKYLLIRIGTDAGIEGIGEATVMPNWSGETVWGAKAILDNVLAPSVIGADPTNIEDIDRRMDKVTRHNWFAKSAIEMACWDIAGKAANKPVYELLGGAVRPLTVRCRFSMGAYEPDRAKARAGTCQRGLHDDQGEGRRSGGSGYHSRPHRAGGDRTEAWPDD